jgi:hypothetical protein
MFVVEYCIHIYIYNIYIICIYIKYTGSTHIIPLAGGVAAMPWESAKRSAKWKYNNTYYTSCRRSGGDAVGERKVDARIAVEKETLFGAQNAAADVVERVEVFAN